MKYLIGRFLSWQKWIKVAGPVLSMLMLTTGCFSHPPAGTVQPWPGPPPDGYATLLMYWNQDAMGSGPSVCIDNRTVFKLHGDSYTWIYVQAGRHNLRTKWMFLMNGLNLDKDITLTSGTSYYLKLWHWNTADPLVMTIHTKLYPVSERTAKRETTNCWFHKPLILRIDAAVKPQEEHKPEPSDAKP